jgi:hypothetical protein
VRPLLPIDQLHQTMERIEQAQWQALRQWQVHTGHAGGLLSGIADLTEDGRPPDAPLCLMRLSKKMQLDKELSLPLAKLAEELDTWQLLLERSRTSLDQGNELVGAYRRRRLVRVTALTTTLVVAAMAMLFIYTWWASRQRVAVILAAEQTCAVDALDARDEGRASDSQAARIAGRRRECADHKHLAAEAAEKARREAAAKREHARKKQERDAQCKTLGEHVESGSLSASDERAAAAEKSDTAVALLRRIASGTIEGTDVSSDLAGLPCQGTDGGKRITLALARAIVATAPGWVLAQAPSKRAVDILTSHQQDIGEEEWTHFGGHVEEVARRAVVRGDEVELKHALTLCDAKQTIGLPDKQHCTAARTLPDR